MDREGEGLQPRAAMGSDKRVEENAGNHAYRRCDGMVKGGACDRNVVVEARVQGE